MVKSFEWDITDPHQVIIFCIFKLLIYCLYFVAANLYWHSWCNIRQPVPDTWPGRRKGKGFQRQRHKIQKILISGKTIKNKQTKVINSRQTNNCFWIENILWLTAYHSLFQLKVASVFVIFLELKTYYDWETAIVSFSLKLTSFLVIFPGPVVTCDNNLWLWRMRLQLG